MVDAAKILDQFLGAGTAASAGRGAQDLVGKVTSSGFAGGAALGGLSALLLSNKKARKTAFGVAKWGAVAGLGVLAWKALQNHKAGQAPQPTEVTDADAAAAPMIPADTATGAPFAEALIRAMVFAARADGHIDEAEESRIVQAVDQQMPGANAHQMIFAMMREPLDAQVLAAAPKTQEQAAEIYLVSCLACEPDHPMERAWLNSLAQALNLPEGLPAHLEAQVTAA